MTTRSSAPPGVALVPMNLDDDSECKILRAQRVICGWKIDIAAKCRKQMQEGRRTLFWITLPAGTTAPEDYGSQDVADLSTIARETSLIPIGHISLDREDFPEAPGMEPVTSLATPDGSCLTITTLFVLPEFRKYGIATWAMLELERKAQDPKYGSQNCRAVAINTLSEHHYDASNPEMVAMWKSIGRPMRPKGTTGWYESMGYRKYRDDIERYPNKTLDGKDVWFFATFMRKDLT